MKKSPKIFIRGFLAASNKFECVNTSKPSLLTAKLFHWFCLWDLNAAWDQFQYMKRVANPFELSGEASCSSVREPGVKLALGETFGGAGWMDFKEVDKAACTYVWNRIVFYTSLQTELNLSSLPIIPLVNSPFHLIPVVLHATSSYTRMCVEKSLCGNWVLFWWKLHFHVCDTQPYPACIVDGFVVCVSRIKRDRTTSSSSILPRLLSLNEIRPSPLFPFTPQHSF